MTDESQPWINPFGWPLPCSDKMLLQSPYAPLEPPAESVAERLVMFAHLGFNMKVWGSQTGRGGRYWDAFRERLEGATNQPTVSRWWQVLYDGIPMVPFKSQLYKHETILLRTPMKLATLTGELDANNDPIVEGVEDYLVLDVLRNNSLYLRDRTQSWAKVRRTLRASERTTDDDSDNDNGDNA